MPGTVHSRVPPASGPQKMEFWFTAEQAAFVQQALDHANRKAGGTLTKEQALAMAAQAFVEGGDGSRRTKRTTRFKCDTCTAVFMDAGGERVPVEPEAAHDADPIVPDAAATPRAGVANDSRAGGAALEMDAASIVYDDRSRHIPMAVQREVSARHHGRCAVPGSCNGTGPAEA